MSSQLVRFNVALGDTNLHFPSDGEGGFTSLAGTGGLTATFTATGGTITGGSSVPGAIGDTGYVFTSDGFYCNYVVITAGVNGTFGVDIWIHPDIRKTGGIPTGTVTFHRDAQAISGDATRSKVAGCTLGLFQRSYIETITIHSNITAAANLIITDPSGNTLDTFPIPVTTALLPATIAINELDGKVYKGPFGFKVSANTMEFDILFRGQKPVTGAALMPSY